MGLYKKLTDELNTNKILKARLADISNEFLNDNSAKDEKLFQVLHEVKKLKNEIEKSDEKISLIRKRLSSQNYNVPYREFDIEDEIRKNKSISATKF